MIAVISHIRYLIRYNDCVIVPGLGAFIVQFESSAFDTEVRKRMMPPFRSLSFNNSLNHNDGLLANSIMRKDGITFDKAMDIIERDVQFIKRTLAEEGEFVIPQLGKLQSYEGYILFLPESELSVAQSPMFGLCPLQLKNVADSIFPEDDILTDKKEERKIIRWDYRQVWRVAAVIAILVVMGITLSTPIKINKTPDYAGFQTTVKVQPIANVSCEGMSNGCNSDTIGQVGNSKTHDAPIMSLETIDKYYVVVASLRTETQAQQFIEDSKSFKDTLRILPNDKGNLFRVYVEKGETFKDMQQYLKNDPSVREAFPDVWICKK